MTGYPHLAPCGFNADNNCNFLRFIIDENDKTGIIFRVFGSEDGSIPPPPITEDIVKNGFDQVKAMAERRKTITAKTGEA